MVSANLIMLAQGSGFGWTAPALNLYASEKTPLLSGPLSRSQISWIGSINCIGGLCGSLCFGWLITLIGSKRSMLLLAIPTLAFWTLIYYGTVYWHILLARFIYGVAGGGIQTTIVLYTSDIANDE